MSALIPRDEWSARPPRGAPVPLGVPRAVVLHHTALPAPARGEEEAHLRELQALHLDRGWDDLGYHVVIAPSGRAYAGRDLTHQGAHAVGANAGTVGICVTGDFEAGPPPAPAVAALRALLAGPFAGLPVVPHRAVGDTVCPGRHLLAALGVEDAQSSQPK